MSRQKRMNLRQAFKKQAHVKDSAAEPKKAFG